MTIRRDLQGTALILALLGLVAGCSIFEPRSPESPGESETCWRVPDLPKKVFENLRCGLESLTTTEYDKSLNLQFRYIPNSQDSLNYSGVFGAQWNQTKEEISMDRLAAEAVSVKIEWGVFGEQNESTPLSWYDRAYEIVVVTSGAGGAQDTTSYAGEARFFMEEISSGWTMRSWNEYDVPDPDTAPPTSGALRALFAP
jgi:hypothetical protein